MVPAMYRVMYVDDEPDLLDIAKIFLERSKEFSVDTKDSAEIGLKDLKQHHYDAIISDYQMPGMDGIAFLKEVRASQGDIPFIIFTGRGREEIIIEALNNGADFYLQKGGEPEALYMELMHVIRRTIQMRQAQVSFAEQEQRLHDLQNASDLIQNVTPDGHFLFVNKKWLDTLGYEEHELANLTLFDIIHEESREHCKVLFPSIMAGDNLGIIEAIFKTRTGEKVFVEGLVTCKITDGKPQYCRGIFKDVTDRKQMEAALAENRDYLAQIYSSVQGGIVLIDAGTHEIIDLNPAAARMMGTTRDQILHKVCHQFICPSEDGKCPITDLHQEVDNTERVLLAADGKKVDIIKYVVPFNFHGRACLLETFLDNTERKKAADDLHAAYERVTAAEEELRQHYDMLSANERALQESEEKFRTIFENSPYPIAINSIPDGKFVEVNAAFLASSGYTESEVLGKTPIDLGLLSLLDFGKFTSRMLLSGRLENVPLALKGKMGIAIHVLFSVIPVTINDRSAILTVTAEVTKLKRVEEELLEKNEDLHAAYEELTATEEELRQNYEALIKQEQALRDSEEKYRLLTEVTRDVIYMVDTQGVITHISPQISRYGYTPDEAISRHFTEFIAAEDQAKVVEDFKKALSTRESTVTQLRIHDKTGNIFWMEDNGAPVLDSSGSVIAVSGILRDVTGRKEAEEALRESEKKYRNIIENIQDVVYRTDRDGKLIMFSPHGVKLAGYNSEEEMIGLDVALDTYKNPEERERFLAAMKEKGFVENYPLLLKTRTGNTRIVTASSHFYYDDQGNVLGIEGILHDITELRKKEQDLCASEEKFRVLVEHSLDGILITDFTGTLLFANQAAGRMVDAADYEALIGKKNVLEFVAPESRVPVLQDFSKVAQGTDAYLVHYKLITEAGREIWVECIGKKIPFGGSTAMLVSMRDITERKAAEIERARIEHTLQESEEKFRTLVEHSLDGILILDMTGKILFSNRAVAEMVEAKVNPDRTYVTNALEYVAPESRAGVLHDLSQVAQGIDCYPVNYQAITANGRRIWIEGIGKRILFQNSPAILVSLRDITPRKRMEEAILRTNKQLTLLSSITRHDVLNKIAVIQGHIAIARKHGDQQDYPALLDKIESVTDIIKSQVEFTRVYQTLGTKEPEWQKPGKILASVPQTDAVTIRSELGDLEVFADLMLEKVFQNLIDNSLRHGGKVSEIRVQSRTGTDGLTIIFEDNGIGIPADEKEKIFERGYGKNTGLGLFLAREILGITDITIRETGEAGKGARFEILVPENA